MRYRSRGLLLIALSTLLVESVSAQSSTARNRFKWRDAAGEVHYADSVPTEAAAKFGYDVVNAQGIVVKHVDRAKTDDERAQAKRDAQKAESDKRAIEQKRRDDDQLLSTYPQESDLRRTQQQQIDMLNQQIRSTEVSLRNQEQTLADLLDRAAEAERTAKALPAEQVDQLAKMRKQVDDQRATVARRESERDAAIGHFAEEIERYRRLRAELEAARTGKP